MYNKIKRNQDKVFYLIFFLCAVFLFWKIQYGYIFNDEPFILTMGHRFAKGDRLLVHEWNFTQTIGVLIAPVIWLYTNITGGTEGLILFCRALYVIWWLITGWVLYRRLKGYGVISIFSVLLFLLYTPLDEMDLTYNVVALSCMVLFSSYFLSEGSCKSDYLHGLFLAIAVWVYPYLIVLYFFYIIGVILANYTRIKKHLDPDIIIFDKGKAFRVSMTAVIAAVFFFCVFIMGTWKESLDALSNMLDTREYTKKTFITLAKLLVKRFPYQMIGGFIVLCISLADKNRNKNALVYMSAQAALLFVSMGQAFVNTYSFNIHMIPVNVVGFQAFILLKKRDYKLAFSLGLIGVMYAVCAFFASDTKLMAFSTGITITGIASLIFIYNIYKESIQYESNVFLPFVGILIILCIQIGGEGLLKLERSYWDGLFPNLTVRITEGSAKGIITTQQYAEKYEAVYDDVNMIKKMYGEGGKLLSVTIFPSIYLDADYEYATNSAWTYSNNKLNYDILNEKLEKYYQLNSDKIPNIIYIGNDDSDMEIRFIDLNAYKPIEGSTGVFYIKE